MSPTPNSDQTLQAARERHCPTDYADADYPRWCDFDGQIWPCDAALVLNLADELAEALGAAKEALWRVSNSSRSEQGKCCACGRGSNLTHAYDCAFLDAYRAWCEARAALAKWEASRG